MRIPSNHCPRILGRYTTDITTAAAEAARWYDTWRLRAIPLGAVATVQYAAAMEHNTAPLQNAQQAARAAETQYNTLTYKCEQEIRVRQQGMAVLKLERRFIISLTVIAGAVGAVAAGLTSEAARWLWATFLAVVSSGWATLAAWWNS